MSQLIHPACFRESYESSYTPCGVPVFITSSSQGTMDHEAVAAAVAAMTTVDELQGMLLSGCVCIA